MDIDDSEWDDPDYELLAFIGRDRPFTRVECGHEPGESVDRRSHPSRHCRSDAPRRRAVGGRPTGSTTSAEDIHAAQEDIEDLARAGPGVRPVRRVHVHGGRPQPRGLGRRLSVPDPEGAPTQRARSSFDMTGLELPQMDVMAFPGEEPPQIECNEDAGGQNTDE